MASVVDCFHTHMITFKFKCNPAFLRSVMASQLRWICSFCVLENMIASLK